MTHFVGLRLFVCIRDSIPQSRYVVTSMSVTISLLGELYLYWVSHFLNGIHIVNELAVKRLLDWPWLSSKHQRGLTELLFQKDVLIFRV